MSWCARITDQLAHAEALHLPAPGVIVAGDFNATPNSALYAYMSRGPAGVDLGGFNRTWLAPSHDFVAARC